ncbi:hypothetical protein [Bradyrhizobium icense]|uniref:Uncharacterized protein n=1 Tax=Bradyrhizobium icense TaxID=1274631 RepID=A0A1B1UBZ8_9BRAD|nr:hypothetical protein [Bradyrhizobium icense]ANW00292.1 hypothetical protein LMTR13_09035 [Bradyrhizobium icense]
MKASLVVALLVSLIPCAVSAQQTSHKENVTPIAQHGGQAFEAGDYHLEWVSKGEIVEVYLTDHDNKAVSGTGHKGVAVILVDGKAQRIPLEPDGQNRLSGKASKSLPTSIKGVVQVTRPNGKTVQGKL